MENSTRKQIHEANALLRTFLNQAREALGGRQSLNLETLRTIAAPLEKMGPISSQSEALCMADARLTADFKEYAENLKKLQTTLEQVHFMLLARQTSLQSSRTHVETLNLWATRLNQTR